MLDIINPAAGKVFKTLETDTVKTVQNKYELLKSGQKIWAEVPIQERIRKIKNFVALLENNIPELSETLTEEMGKPLNQSAGEIRGAVGRINFFVKNSIKWLSDEVVYEEEGLQERISFEPLGVIANISAWNYPYLVGVNVYIPALIAGNSVFYKPSEYTSMTGLAIRDLLYEAGIPKDVFQVVIGGAEAGESLLNLPLDGYYFTGSVKTGKYIYERVAPKMVPCQVELGGKDPMYVHVDNKDIKSVAAAAVEGAFYNNGQSCCAVERIYVNDKVYDTFIEEFVNLTKALKLGDPKEEGIFVGPLARKEQIEFLKEQVEDAVSKGAKILTGGKPADRQGFYFEPTVLVDVNHTMRVMTEESFGPVIGIQKVASDDEAIQLMRDTEYGLAASVYSDHEETALPVLKRMDTGTVYWNCCDRVSANLPWSGRRNSGIGATLSYMGIRAFTQPKAYHLRG